MLIDEIQTDLIKALKNHEVEKLDTLRFLKSGIKNLEIEKGNAATDDEVITHIRKQIDLLGESLEQFQKAGRSDLVDKNYFQMQVLSSYLPPEISDEELDEEVRNIIDENKALASENPKALIGICIKFLKTKAKTQRIITAVNKNLSL